MASAEADLAPVAKVDKVPAQVVAECQANLAEAEAQAELARKCLADLS